MQHALADLKTLGKRSHADLGGRVRKDLSGRVV